LVQVYEVLISINPNYFLRATLQLGVNREG